MSLQTDFMVAVNQIAAERNIDPDEVLEAIKLAIQTGFRKDYPEEEVETVQVDIDKSNGMISVLADKKVVESVTNPKSQIALVDAQKIEPKLKVGDHVQVDITPSGDFGRVAAQAAKQVILQKIRESEKNAVMSEFTGHIGEIEYGVVQRMDGDSVIFEIRRATASMPLEDRIPSEFYKSGSRLKVLLKEIRETSRGKQLIVSRSDPKFLEALFKLEVPEIVSGSVEILSMAREAGSRSKVAVNSTVEGVDPIGACVGQKGVRINAIMNELKFGNHEEKIDIIAYAEEISEFIANALSPAQVIKVTIKDEKKKEALVIVPDEQLSLAIGRDGQNVRLAAKLTSWNIDIQGETVEVKDNQLDEEQRQKLAEARRARMEAEEGGDTEEKVEMSEETVETVDEEETTEIAGNTDETENEQVAEVEESVEEGSDDENKKESGDEEKEDEVDSNDDDDKEDGSEDYEQEGKSPDEEKDDSDDDEEDEDNKDDDEKTAD